MFRSRGSSSPPDRCRVRHRWPAAGYGAGRVDPRGASQPSNEVAVSEPSVEDGLNYCEVRRYQRSFSGRAGALGGGGSQGREARHALLLREPVRRQADPAGQPRRAPDVARAEATARTRTAPRHARARTEHPEGRTCRPTGRTGGRPSAAAGAAKKDMKMRARTRTSPVRHRRRRLPKRPARQARGRQPAARSRPPMRHPSSTAANPSQNATICNAPNRPFHRLDDVHDYAHRSTCIKSCRQDCAEEQSDLGLTAAARRPMSVSAAAPAISSSRDDWVGPHATASNVFPDAVTIHIVTLPVVDELDAEN